MARPGQVLFELDYPLLVQRELDEIGQEVADVPAGSGPLSQCLEF